LSLEFDYYSLGDLVKIKYGKNQKKVQDDENGKYPIYGTGGLMGYSIDYLYDKPSVLIGRKGSIEKVRYIEEPFWTVDTLFYTEVNEKIVIPKFLYYMMSLIDLSRYNEGTSIPSLRTETLNRLDFPIPNLDYQNRVLSILSSIDKKIEINEKINKNLEQLSQNLFKKWFIDFDLKSDFNISESFKESSLGEIPESWQIKTIGDLSDVKGRIGWRGYTTNDLVDEGPWVIGGKEITLGFIDFNSAKHLTREKYEESPEIMLKDKDLIIAKTGTIGPIAMYYDVYGEATLNPNVGLIRSKNINSALLLTFFKTQRAQYYLNEFTTSSVQPAINQTTIKQLEVALPSDKQLLKNMESKFEEINSLQFNLNEEIKKLSKLRDTLLPKLMSGEIDVSKINCDLLIKILEFLFFMIIN